MKVSVIIPTYNRKVLVCKAIDSVLQQSYSDIEIIVVDDGSTDGTTDHLSDTYGSKVICIKQTNKGFGAARNLGVNAATGDLIAFIDSDDLWQEHKLAMQVEIMKRFPDLSFIFTDFIIFNDNGRFDHKGLQTWFDEPKRWKDLLPHTETVSLLGLSSGSDRQDEVVVYVGDMYYHLMSQCYVLPSTAVVRADRIVAGVCHTEGDPINADWDFFALLSKNGKAGYVDRETALNRSHDDGVRATTNVDAQEKIRYRFASLARIWRTDSSFMEAHGADVNKVESRLWLRMAKYSYFQNDRWESRRALREYWRRGVDEGKATARLLELLNCIPWSGPVMRKLLDLRQ